MLKKSKLKTKNYLGIDFGTKHIGLAIAIRGIISPLTTIANDSNTTAKIQQIILDHQIHKVYVGISQGKIADITKEFVAKLSGVLKLPVETVDESFSTIEAETIYKANRGSKKHYHHQIDAVSAAVILNRLLI